MQIGAVGDLKKTHNGQTSFNRNLKTGIAPVYQAWLFDTLNNSNFYEID